MTNDFDLSFPLNHGANSSFAQDICDPIKKYMKNICNGKCGEEIDLRLLRSASCSFSVENVCSFSEA